MADITGEYGYQVTSSEPGIMIPADGTSSSIPITATEAMTMAGRKMQMETQTEIQAETQTEIQTETPTRFKVGDIVVLIPGTRYYTQAPNNCPGIIREIRTETSLPYIIQWNDGSSNSYGEEDITEAPGNLIKKARRKQATIQIGKRVMGISKNMRHYNYIGVIDKMEDYDKKIWIKWTDGKLTYTRHISDLIPISDIVKCPEPQPLGCHQCSSPCRVEIQRRRQVDIEQKEKEIVEREIIEKREKYKEYNKTHTIKISTTLYAFLLRELEEFVRTKKEYPFMYLLGMNRDNIITKAYILRGNGGCKDMQDISTYEIKMVRGKIFKSKLLIAGIGRVGKFNNYNDHGLVDISKMSSDVILLSMNSRVIWANKQIQDGHYREKMQLDVDIINLKRGGERDGKSSKSKENKESKETDISNGGGTSETVSN